jgi:hypothetical protein
MILMKTFSIFTARNTLNRLSIAGLLSLSTAVSAMALPGELVISEVMANPAAVSDTAGEWFEIFNQSTNDIDLNGLVLTDNGSNSHTVSNVDPLILASGSYFVFGRNNDTAANGGVDVDYLYSNFTLGNTNDAINLLFDGLLIDSLIYSSGSSFGAAGQSSELTLSGFQLTDEGLVYGNGDIGTPGYAGSYAIPVASEVPLPAASWLFASALVGLLKFRRFKA